MNLNNSKVCICSDIHLGLHFSSSQWHNICLDFARNLKNILNNNNIKDLIILGDVLDNRNEVSVTTLHVLSDFFNILEDFNIIITTGNHDCYYNKRSDVYSISVLKDWHNIEIIDKMTVYNFFDKKIAFCPWNTQPEEIPSCDIIMGHFEINSFKLNNFSICERGIESSILLSKAPIIFSGHFHKTEYRKYKNGSIIYTGSPFEQNWGEYLNTPGVYFYNFLNDDIQFIENTVSPKHKKIRLTELTEEYKIPETIKHDITNNIVILIIDKLIEQHIIDDILSKFYEYKPLSLSYEYIDNDKISITNTETEVDDVGVDILTDIRNFIESSNMEDKDWYINYLEQKYNECRRK